ncbi:MAG: HEAT repeat domain-containing protein [Candidatus Promineifilaceae bacterium]
MDLAKLLQGLENPNPDVRETALEFLAEHLPINTITLVLPLLNDDDCEVRGTAAFCLGETEDVAVIPHLLRYITWEADESARVYGIEALEGFSTPDIKNSLIQEAYRSQGRAMRVSVARQLGKYDEPQVINVLLYLWQQTDDPHVGITIADALEQLNCSHLKAFWIGALETVFHPYICRVALRALANLEGDSEKEIVNKMMCSLNSKTRQGATFLLSLEETSENKQRLIEISKADPDAQAQSIAL